MNNGVPREVRIAAGAVAFGAQAVVSSTELVTSVTRQAGRLPIVGPIGRRLGDRLAAEGDYVLDNVVPVAVDYGKRIVVIVISAIIAELDLTNLVRAHADLDAIAADLDIDAILDRVDLIGLAEQIIDGVDLPGIVRDASTSVTAEVMTDVRSTSERADDAVANAIGRMLRRKVNGANITGADTTVVDRVPGD